VDSDRRCQLCRRRPPTARNRTTRRSKSSWLGEAEPDFDRRKLRWQGSNLRFAINSRASYRSTTSERKAEAAGFEPAWRQATGALAVRCLSKSTMPPSGRRGSRTPKAETHPFSRRDTAPDGSPSIGDPGRSRTCMWPIKNRLLCRLSYGARGVIGRNRTCNAPRFKRALYLF
jgi:hypothetical protein